MFFIQFLSTFLKTKMSKEKNSFVRLNFLVGICTCILKTMDDGELSRSSAFFMACKFVIDVYIHITQTLYTTTYGFFLYFRD